MVIEPEEGAIAHLLSKAGKPELPRDFLRAAVHSQKFHWGKLLSLDWGALSYVPGGVEYCLLPAGGPAVSVGFLRLDWATVRLNRTL